MRCVSVPSWDLFDAQPATYRDEVLPPKVTARLAVELGVVVVVAAIRGDVRVVFQHRQRRKWDVVRWIERVAPVPSVECGMRHQRGEPARERQRRDHHGHREYGADQY